MTRPNFLTSPGTWVRASRTAQSAADYACAVERGPKPISRAERWAGVLLAVALGVGGAFLLAYWLAA